MNRSNHHFRKENGKWIFMRRWQTGAYFGIYEVLGQGLTPLDAYYSAFPLLRTKVYKKRFWEGVFKCR